MPRFSVITITNNDRDGFAKTMQSVNDQSCRDFEWIVVHGGSQDGTLDLIKENSRDISWHCSGKDKGIYDAMNIGTDHATGDYLIYMNGGDTFADPAILDKIDYHAHIKHDPDYVFGNGYEVHQDGRKALKKAYGIEHMTFAPPSMHQATFFKRDALHGLHYDTKYRIAADYDFQLRFLQNSESHSYIDIPICDYNMCGLSSKKRFQSMLEVFKVRQDTLGIDFASNAMHITKQVGAYLLRKTAPKLHQQLRDNLFSIKVENQCPSSLSSPSP